jgi:hypothetical protein
MRRIEISFQKQSSVSSRASLKHSVDNRQYAVPCVLNQGGFLAYCRTDVWCGQHRGEGVAQLVGVALIIGSVLLVIAQ